MGNIVPTACRKVVTGILEEEEKKQNFFFCSPTISNSEGKPF
jgi:hypothetical protein